MKFVDQAAMLLGILLLSFSTHSAAYKCELNKEPIVTCGEYGYINNMTAYRNAIYLYTLDDRFDDGNCRDRCVQSNRGFCPYKDGCHNGYCPNRGKCVNKARCKAFAFANRGNNAGRNCYHFDQTVEDMGFQLMYPTVDPEVRRKEPQDELQFWNVDGCMTCDKHSDCTDRPCNGADGDGGEADAW